MSNSQVKAVYLAACHLKMDRVVKECTRHFIKNLSVENCIETRSLPGIARNKVFVDQVDAFIAKEVRHVFYGDFCREVLQWIMFSKKCEAVYCWQSCGIVELESGYVCRPLCSDPYFMTSRGD